MAIYVNLIRTEVSFIIVLLFLQLPLSNSYRKPSKTYYLKFIRFENPALKTLHKLFNDNF